VSDVRGVENEEQAWLVGATFELISYLKKKQKQKHVDPGEGGRERGEKRQHLKVVEAASHHGGADAKKQDGK
jgi:hypothetical protein